MNLKNVRKPTTIGVQGYLVENKDEEKLGKIHFKRTLLMEVDWKAWKGWKTYHRCTWKLNLQISVSFVCTL